MSSTDVRTKDASGDVSAPQVALKLEVVVIPERRTGEADENWPDWNAASMVAEQAGTELAS